MPNLTLTKLTDRQRELVSLMRVKSNFAVFGSSERIADWTALRKVMVTLGGKWKTGGRSKDGGFLFPEDVDGAEVVRLAAQTGEILDPKAFGFFPTPPPFADVLVKLADIGPVDDALEPSAGTGNIARAIRKRHPDAKILCAELLPANCAALARDGFEVFGNDFLSIPPPISGLKLDTVVMNPPFANRADIQHVTHALKFVRPGGSLVSVMSAGVIYRDDRIGETFRKLVDSVHGRFITNPDGTFAPSGTMVRTVTLVVGKR